MSFLQPQRNGIPKRKRKRQRGQIQVREKPMCLLQRGRTQEKEFSKAAEVT
jgi:hypothetical protein